MNYTWTYTIDPNSITSSDNGTYITVSVFADGVDYGETFTFPVTEDLTGLDAKGLISVVSPYVKEITDFIDPIYYQKQSDVSAAISTQEVAATLTDPITL